MKKVAIITLNGNNNYGNRLQNYALTKKLEEYNTKPYTIWIKESLTSRIKGIIKRIVGIFSRDLRIRNKRFKKFKEFTKRNIKKFYIKEKDILHLDEKFNLFIFGSDQVWNPDVVNRNNLSIAKFPNKFNMASYAASLGVDEVDDGYKKTMNEKLKSENFKNISVREKKAKEILERITDRKDIEVLIDPTLLLTTQEWSSIIKRPKRLNQEKYILNYFLGDLENEQKREIEKIAKENGYEIIDILNEKCNLFDCDPGEFLYLEKNASLICTDSFHASVFAFLFNRPFIIFKRKGQENKMYSRLENLINTFNLEDREYDGNSITKANLEHDYTIGYEILKKEKEKSIKFFTKILK